MPKSNEKKFPKLDKIAIGERTKEEALRVLGKIKDLADQTGMGYSSFHSSYIKGKSLPGAKLISIYIKLGLNINYILHGSSSSIYIADNKEEYNPTQAKNIELINEIEDLKKKLAKIHQLSA